MENPGVAVPHPVACDPTTSAMAHRGRAGIHGVHRRARAKFTQETHARIELYDHWAIWPSMSHACFARTFNMTGHLL